MPPFFENCLPEGWTESVVLASNKLSREDLFGLFSTTRKYLSNLTLRPLGIPDEELVYDAHSVRIRDRRPTPEGVVHLIEELGALPDDASLWRRTRSDGLLRLSGVQAKLPVSLFRSSAGETIRMGDLRHACTHILKVPVAQFPHLVENEWATMELARRIGLPVADVAMVEFQVGSRYEGRSLLVERYDIPDREHLESTGEELILLEDACALLGLRREQKYDPSLERVADALVAAGVGATAMRHFLQLVTFSWLVGNGDLHAKNVSVLNLLRTAGPGEPPKRRGIALAPFYDLLNTRLYLTGDEFALPVDGRSNNLRLKSFSRLGGRWGMDRNEVRADVERLVRGVSEQQSAVLVESGLPDNLRAKYESIVQANIDGLGL
jgi:serine/threonine-protein kinase HipA